MKIFRTLSDDDREFRTRKRALRQKELTSICEYSSSSTRGDLNVYSSSESGETKHGYHLLSEGVIVDEEGDAFEIISKGSIKKWYDNLPDDDNVTYPINLGHQPHIPIFKTIGMWRKSDLSVIENTDGRHSLYVHMHLDEDSLVVKELRRQKSLFGLSVEFYSTLKNVEFEGETVRAHYDLEIDAFAIVVESQDAYSGNIDLSSEHLEDKDNHMSEGTFRNALLTAFGVKSDTKIDTSVEENVSVEEDVESTEETTIETDSESIEETDSESIEEADSESTEETDSESIEETDSDDENESGEFKAVDIATLLSVQNDLLVEQKQSFSELSSEVKTLADTIKTASSFSIGTSQSSSDSTNRRIGF